MASLNSADYLLERLRRLIIRRWWWRTALLWLTVGSISLWGFRDEMMILQKHFTWTALRYGLAYNRLAAVGLGLCIGLTIALLVAESRHIVFGLSDAERQRLQHLQQQIEHKGHEHPLWKRLNGSGPS